MPNRFEFNPPVTRAPLAIARIVEAGRVNKGLGIIAIIIGLETSTGVDLGQWELTITNETSDTIVADPSVLQGFRISPGVPIPDAFTAVMTAFVSAEATGGDSETAMLSAMSTIGVLPPGSVS